MGSLREAGAREGYIRRGGRGLADHSGDPMESMGNLFDVAILLAVGFLVVALTGFGLSEVISGEDVTIVKNPGHSDMEIITRTAGEVERLERTDDLNEGRGYAIGTVYRLEDGSVIWVPQEGTP
jgi:hypothetical protein